MSTADHEALLNTVAGALVVEELVRSGVDQFVVAPGSRSTPIVEAIVRHPHARMTSSSTNGARRFMPLGLAGRRGVPRRSSRPLGAPWGTPCPR